MPESAERPNIILITTDQQRFDTIRAHGAGHMRTPTSMIWHVAALVVLQLAPVPCVCPLGPRSYQAARPYQMANHGWIWAHR